jgi:hypothetical protein
MMARQKTETKTVDGMPHAEVLKTLASQVSGEQADMDSARGKIGQFMKNAEDKFGVHRKAFKLGLQLKKQDSTKLAEFLRHFDHIRGVFELDKLAGVDMFKANAAEEAAKAAGVPVEPSPEAAAAEGVKRLKAGIKGMPGAEAAPTIQ